MTLGLNEDKSDRLFIGLNPDYPLENLFLNQTRRQLLTSDDFQTSQYETDSAGRVELQLDYDNKRME